jgi:hypothetical protein
MKTILILLTLTVTVHCFAQAPVATPVPVVILDPTLDSATATTVAQATAKKQLAQVCAQAFVQLKAAYLAAANILDHNKDGLTRDQVLAGLGVDNAAKLQSLAQTIYTILNAQSPGSVPAPPAQ